MEANKWRRHHSEESNTAVHLGGVGQHLQHNCLGQKSKSKIEEELEHVNS